MTTQPTNLVPVPAITHQNVKPGIDLIFIDVPAAQVADVRFYFDTGFRDVDVRKHHVPHILEHMLMESQINSKTLQDRLTPLGADTNATTDFDSLWMFARLPAVHAHVAVKEIISAFKQVELSDTLLQREKQVVIREAASQLDGLYPEVSSWMYANALNNTVPATFEEQSASVEATTIADIKRYYQKYFVTSGLKIVITGSTTDEQKADIQRQVKNLERRHEFRPLKNIQLRKESSIQPLPVMPMGALSVLNFVSRLENEAKVRQASTAESFLMSYYFNGARTDAVKSLRERGLLYGVELDVSRFAALCDRTISITTEPARSREGMLAILDIFFSSLVIEGGDKFELERSYAMNTMPLQLETVHDVANWYCTDITAGRTLWHVNDEIRQLKDMKPEDVRQQAYEMLCKSKWQIGMASLVHDHGMLGLLEELKVAIAKTSSPKACYDTYTDWRRRAEELPYPKTSLLRKFIPALGRM